ncbi:MAG: hypothetical protein AVDCRST_MAG64-3914 [uncultured Phycisphaerae bacterium]|uniref:Uncharacterized protein n=1 Tax=uncultured Phycisphaerae bacterium TaxID=904963 RepID=A0A6J4QHA4_9BACT|nr:MAG: hypothetical protein AVDCRST_MAG64-3914 [uncultured Phycisphaerae bacterium]
MGFIPPPRVAGRGLLILRKMPNRGRMHLAKAQAAKFEAGAVG